MWQIHSRGVCRFEDQELLLPILLLKQVLPRTPISIGESGAGFGLEQRTFRWSLPTASFDHSTRAAGPPWGGEEVSEVWTVLIQLWLRPVRANVWSKENEMEGTGREIRDCCTYIFAEKCLNITTSSFLSGRGELCLCRWCLVLRGSQSWWTVSWSLPSFEFLM